MRSKLEDPTQARRVRSSLIGCENKDLVKTGFRSRSIFERTAKYWYTAFFIVSINSGINFQLSSGRAKSATANQ